MSCVGLWPNRSRRQLIAVAVDGDGRPGLPMRVARTDEAAVALLAYLEAAHRGLAFELVMSDGLAQRAPVARVALANGISLWLAPDGLVDAVRAVARLTIAPPHRTAAALARLPLASVFRPQLRRLGPGDQRQLSLW
jgi:hypothetical protein